MKKITCKKLSADAFSRFGSFADMIAPEKNTPASIKLCDPPIEFFRDMLQSGLGLDTVASFGVCRVGPRPNIIDASEYHDGACEAMMPIDGDVVIAVAPALAGSEFPGHAVEAYLVPKGTMVILRPGVWHHGPFTVGTKTVSCLVALPERLYARDCVEIKLSEDKKIKIVGGGLKA